jgi:hypothetical protein
VKRTALIWTVVFLALTAAPITMELVAGLDTDPNTVPWTQLITRYVPWELALALYAALAAWLPIHFYVRYRRKGGRRSGAPTVARAPDLHRERDDRSPRLG